MSLFEVVLLIMYAGASLEAFWQSNHWKAVYWLGAIVVTLAVIKGIK